MAWFRRALPAFAVIALGFSGVSAQDETGEEGSSGETAERGGEAVDPAEAPALRVLNKKHVTQEMRDAVNKGLKELANQQDPVTGAFNKGGGQNVAIAVTSLAGLAMLASGSTPDRGPYSGNIQKAIDYLLSCQDVNNGYFSAANDGSRIHGHGYATLFLAQVFGMQSQNDDKLRKALTSAVECIERGQTAFGGWGYVPDDLTWDEGSTTVCCIQALRASSDAGIIVKKETIQKAIKYLYDSADARPFTVDGIEYKGYTFKYSLASNWNPDSYAICAAAISTMNGIGIYAEGATWKEHDIGKIYKGGLDWLRYKFDDFVARIKQGQNALDTRFFYYAHFYGAQAMWNAPDEIFFDEYFPKVREYLLDEQIRSGSDYWPHSMYGKAYATALALLILQVPYQMLPLYAK